MSTFRWKFFFDASKKWIDTQQTDPNNLFWQNSSCAVNFSTGETDLISLLLTHIQHSANFSMYLQQNTIYFILSVKFDIHFVFSTNPKLL